jgi:hypothetical protein
LITPKWYNGDMERYQVIHIPPQKETWIVIDNALDGYVIGECHSEKETEEFITLRESQDVVHSI